MFARCRCGAAVGPRSYEIGTVQGDIPAIIPSSGPDSF